MEKFTLKSTGEQGRSLRLHDVPGDVTLYYARPKVQLWRNDEILWSSVLC